MTTDLYTLEDAESHIAQLRGLVDRMSEIIGSPGGIVMIQGEAVAIDPVNGGPETWHSLGTLAGYTVQAGRYRLTPENETEFDIEVTSAGANAASVAFSNAVPAAYRPLNDRHPALGMTGNQAGAGFNWPRLLVQQSTGSVFVVQPGSNAASLGCTVRVPLD